MPLSSGSDNDGHTADGCQLTLWHSTYIIERAGCFVKKYQHQDIVASNTAVLCVVVVDGGRVVVVVVVVVDVEHSRFGLMWG